MINGAGSPAIDAGDNSSDPATDQRGEDRIADGDADTVATVHIGAFEMIPGDLNVDGIVDATDINLLRDAVINSTSNPAFNVDGIGGNVPNAADFDYMILTVIGTLFGDANLNFSVTSQYFVLLSNTFNGVGACWDEGNFNLDVGTTFQDFVLLSNNFGMTAPSAGGNHAESAHSESSNPLPAPGGDDRLIASVSQSISPAVRINVSAPQIRIELNQYQRPVVFEAPAGGAELDQHTSSRAGAYRDLVDSVINGADVMDDPSEALSPWSLDNPVSRLFNS